MELNQITLNRRVDDYATTPNSDEMISSGPESKVSLKRNNELSSFTNTKTINAHVINRGGVANRNSSNGTGTPPSNARFHHNYQKEECDTSMQCKNGESCSSSIHMKHYSVTSKKCSPVYRCKKCRSILATADNIIPHSKYSKNHNQIGNCSYYSEIYGWYCPRIFDLKV